MRNFFSPLTEVKSGLSTFVETQNAKILEFPGYIAVASYDLEHYHDIHELALRIISQRQISKDFLNNRGFPTVFSVKGKRNFEEKVIVGSSTIVKAIKLELGILPTPGIVDKLNYCIYQQKLIADI